MKKSLQDRTCVPKKHVCGYWRGSRLTQEHRELPGLQEDKFPRSRCLSGSVYGIDISEGMNRITQARIQKAGLSDRVMLTCQDATSLPYSSGFFDALFLSYTLELFDTPEIPSFLAECHRVVKDGGRICVVALAKQERDSWAVRLYEWAHKQFPRSVDCRPIFAQKVLSAAGFLPGAIKRRSMFRLPVEVIIAKKV